MREKDRFLSAEKIMEEDLFKNYEIEMEELFNKLWERELLKRKQEIIN